MKHFRILLCACAAYCGAPLEATAAPARFWLSASSVDPDIEAPAIQGVNGTTRYLHIWAQPGTGSPSLENLSLNVVSPLDNSVIEFVDGSYTVYNPEIAGKKRFQYTYDSHTLNNPLVWSSPTNFEPPHNIYKGLVGLQGFSINNSNVRGLGDPLECQPGGVYCANTNSSGPAWLLASVAVRTIATTGSSDFNLQIGQNGMNYFSQTLQVSEVVFGANIPGPGPIYNSTVINERGVTDPFDTADVSVTATSVLSSTWNSTAGGQWSTGPWTAGTPSFATNATLPATLPGTSVVTVTGRQAANSTDVSGGRLHVSADSSLASSVAVGPSGAISGKGWVGADLTMQTGATLVADLAQPLLVVGGATVTGAQIRLACELGSCNIPAQLEILRANGPVQFSAPPNQLLGGGLRLTSVTTIAVQPPATFYTSVVANIAGISGDYNGNNIVDAADYVVWRNSLNSAGTALAADGNHDHIVNQADLAVWRANFGRTAPAGAGMGSMNNVIPEPASSALLALGLIPTLWTTLARRGRPHRAIVAATAT